MHQIGSGFVCGDCGRTYKLKSSLRNHRKWECGKEPRFNCSLCSYKAKQKMHMLRHMHRVHRDELNAKKLNASVTDIIVPQEKNEIKLDKIINLVHHATFGGKIVIRNVHPDETISEDQ